MANRMSGENLVSPTWQQMLLLVTGSCNRIRESIEKGLASLAGAKAVGLSR